MKSFLQQVVDELIRRFGWSGLKDVTLVFPMHRAGVVMRSELQRRMAAEHPKALWAPEMLALGDLFDSLCPLAKEDELFTVCRLHRIYSSQISAISNQQSAISNQKPMDLDRFYGWGRQLLSDFTNIDQSIRPSEIDAFFRNALSLSDLDTYHLDEDVRRRLEDLLYKGEARRQSLIAESVQAHFTALWHAMPEIYHNLRDELEQAGKGYEGQRMRYVITHWDELRSRATSRMYCFIGFNYLLPVERQLMQCLQDEGRALFFWDYVEDFHANTKAFAFIRQNLLTLPNALPAARWGGKRTIRTVSVTSTHAEAGFAGRWMQQAYKSKGESTAIVICDEAQLEPVIYSLPLIRLEGSDAPEEVNITKGYPLRHTPVFADVVKRLDMAFRKHPDDPAQALQNAVAFVDGLSALSMSAQNNSWSWHLGREALYQTRRTLIQFITILSDGLIGDLTAHPDLLQRLIRRHLEQLTLPFHGEPVTDLQIMGVLETRTLDFRHLLLLNVEEGVIPAHQPDKSFLPYYLRKAYGLQTHDERASVYAYNFFRLLNRAEDVTILFSQSQTAMMKKSMSRFVMQMLVCPEQFEVTKFTLTESNTLTPARTLTVPEGASWAEFRDQNSEIKNLHGSADRQKFEIINPKLYLSPSAINTFFTCKRKFYLQYMLGLHDDDEQETIFSNRTLGLFVHEAIRYLYEIHCGCKNKGEVVIHPNQVEQMNTPAKRSEALQAAYERLNAAYLNDHPGEQPIYIAEQHALENRVIDTYIEHVLARDRYDAEHRGLTILLLESAQYTTVRVPLQNADETVDVSIGGRLDRMDCIGGLNGTPKVVRIVDYKCGKYNAKKMSAKSDDLLTPEKPDTDYVRQTLLYSYVAYMQRIQDSGFRIQDSEVRSQNSEIKNLKFEIINHKFEIEPHLYFTSQDLTGDRTLTRVSIDKSPITYDDSTHEQFSDVVQQMVGAIVREREFAQCENCSQYCPFLRLCARKPQKF